jgi:hypothetical protein
LSKWALFSAVALQPTAQLYHAPDIVSRLRLDGAAVLPRQDRRFVGSALCVLGLIDAALGRREEALREGQRAVELLPVEKDQVGGNVMIKYLAMIAARLGDKDLACEQLAIALRRPSDLSYGQLKLMPFWDPLRGDPQFEKLVEERSNQSC